MADSDHPTSPRDQSLSDKGLPPSHPDHQHAQPASQSIFDSSHSSPPQQANPTNTHPHASDSSSSFVPSSILFPPNAHESFLSQQERGLMADITLDPDDPVAWLWSLNDASLPNRDATSGLLQSRSPSASATIVTQRPPVPAPAPNATGVASISPSISPSPFAQPSRSSSHQTSRLPEREIAHPRDKAAISTTGSGDDNPTTSEYVIDHAPLSREDDSQANPGDPVHKGSQFRGESTGSDFEMRVASPHNDQDQNPSQSQPPTRSSSSQSSVPLPRMSKTPLFLPSPSESNPSTHSPSEPPPPRRRNRHRDPNPLDVISVTSSSLPPPPRRSPRKIRKRGIQLMAYVLIPPLSPGVRRSDYAPVQQRLRTRERQTAVKRKARAGDNSGNNQLMHVLQGAFENNWPGTGPREKKRTKKAVIVVDDEEEEEKEKSKIPTPLDQALATAFTYNSANPKVAASASAFASAPVRVATSGSTRRLAKETRADTSSDSSSVEVVVPSPTKRTRTHARAQTVSNRNNDRSPVSPRGKGKRHPHTPASPPRKRRRMAWVGDASDEREQDDSDDEIEIVDAPRESRRVPKAKPQPSGRPQPKHKPRRAAPQHRASTPPAMSTSTPTPSPPPQQRISPVTPPDVNTLAGLPLTILPAPARTNIVIPPRALSHLNVSPGPPDPGAGGETKAQQMQQHAIRQGFCYEGAASCAHGLLATIPAAVEPTPTTDSGVCATTTKTTIATEPGLQHASLDLHLDLDVSMDLGDGPADADAGASGVVDVVVPPHPPHPLLRIAGTHDHPDGPMLGFVIPEHEGADADVDSSADVDLGHTYTSSDRDFDLASLNACASAAGEGWIDWRAEHVLGDTGADTDTGIGEYAGDGTIDPSMLGGAPGKSEDYASSPVRWLGRDGGVRPSDAADEDDEEEDVLGLLFGDTSDDDFVPPLPSGLGKGKGKGVAGSPESVGVAAAAAGTRFRRKSWRKELADEAETEHRVRHNDDSDSDGDSDDESDEDGPRVHALSAPVFPDAHRPNRPAPSSASGMLVGGLAYCHHCRRKTRRPKMRCALVKESTDERCGKLFCDLCIEKRYPDLTFDRSAEAFACPVCRDCCNCSLCSRKRGEEYIHERAGGWRSWVARHGGDSHHTACTPKSRNTGTAAAAKQRAKPTTTTDAQVFDGSWSATAVFTVSGEPLGSAFLHGDKARIVPVPQATAPPSPVTTTTTTTTATTTTTTTTTTTDITDAVTSPIPKPAQKQQRRYVFIGKPLRAWGRLVSLPDPERDQPEQKKTIGKGAKAKARAQARGGHRRGKRTRLFVGSLEPLLVARRRRKINRRRSAPSLPLSAARDANAHHIGASDDDDDDDDDDGNLDEGADADADADDGVWPGEYVVAPAPAVVVVGPEPEPELEPKMVAARITPEEVERAIGAAFAIGAAA